MSNKFLQALIDGAATCGDLGDYFGIDMAVVDTKLAAKWKLTYDVCGYNTALFEFTPELEQLIYLNS